MEKKLSISSIPGDTSLSADPSTMPFMEVMSELFGKLQLS